VREQGIPFSAAHAIAARVAGARQTPPARSLTSILVEASGEVLGTPLHYTEEELERILSPRHFVNIRRTHGGPAPEETRRAAADAHARWDVDSAWVAATTDAIATAARRLAERAAAL
jgi:argininosuccinate lyase